MAINVVVSNVPGQAYKTIVQAGNNRVVLDASKTLGGQGVGPTPHEMLLGALGACTSITLDMYAKRKQWDLDEVKVLLTETKVLDPNGNGKQIPQISKEIRVTGNLDAAQLSQLKVIAEKCPVEKLVMGDKVMASTLDLIV